VDLPFETFKASVTTTCLGTWVLTMGLLQQEPKALMLFRGSILANWIPPKEKTY